MLVVNFCHVTWSWFWNAISSAALRNFPFQNLFRETWKFCALCKHYLSDVNSSLFCILDVSTVVDICERAFWDPKWVGSFQKPTSWLLDWIQGVFSLGGITWPLIHPHFLVFKFMASHCFEAFATTPCDWDTQKSAQSQLGSCSSCQCKIVACCV